MTINTNDPLGRHATYLLNDAEGEDVSDEVKFKKFTKAMSAAAQSVDEPVDEADIMTSLYLFLKWQANTITAS